MGNPHALLVGVQIGVAMAELLRKYMELENNRQSVVVPTQKHKHYIFLFIYG